MSFFTLPKNTYLGLLELDLSFIGQITFITNQKLMNIFAGITINFLQPFLNVIKSLLARYIVHNDDTVGTSIVGGGDRSVIKKLIRFIDVQGVAYLNLS